MNPQQQAPAAPGTAVTSVTPTVPKPKAFDPMGLAVDPKAENITCSLGQGMTMRGTLRGRGGMIVRGTFEGDLIIEDDEHGKGGTVFVADTGVVRGMIVASRIVIYGEAESVVASAHLVLAKTAKISEHTFFDQMASEAGAQIEGVIRRLRPGLEPIAEIMASRNRAANERDQGAAQGGGASLHAVAANG